MTTMRISQLAERTGVPASTLRYYETAGLLPAARTGAGYRVYDEAAVRRLAFIGAGKHLGLALEEIADLLTVWESGPCAQVKAELRPRLDRRLAQARRRAAELAEFDRTLRGAVEHLDRLPDRDQPCDEHCRFPGAEPADRWRSAPVACDLAAADRPGRLADWHALLGDTTPTEIPDGLRFTLPIDRTTAVAALAAAEQACCPFFDFRLHLDGADLHLEVRAPESGAGLLAGLAGLAGPAGRAGEPGTTGEPGTAGEPGMTGQSRPTTIADPCPNSP